MVVADQAINGTGSPLTAKTTGTSSGLENHLPNVDKPTVKQIITRPKDQTSVTINNNQSTGVKSSTQPSDQLKLNSTKGKSDITGTKKVHQKSVPKIHGKWCQFKDNFLQTKDPKPISKVNKQITAKC